jgi:hypothetical protein
MANWPQYLDNPTPSASPRRGCVKDTAKACRERASADLLRSVAMINVNQRLVLERSSEAWTLRADLLERVARSAPSPGVPEEVEHVRL